MELKQVIASTNLILQIGFNRTFMELKLIIGKLSEFVFLF